MKQNRIISTAALVLFLGISIHAFAQEGNEKKGEGGGKAQQAQPEHAQQAQPQHTQKAQPQRAQQTQQQQTQKAQPQRAQQTQQQQTQKAQPQRAQQTQQQQTQKAQPQRAQQTQQQQTQKAQPQRAQQTQPVAQNRGNNGNHYGRIPDDHYHANFGHGHSFHMIRPQMISGYNRFQYGGYWFGFNQGWPSGWSYDDDVYVEYVDGVYYLYDLRHPGIRITLNIF
jgi:hypothetical protein